MNEDDEDDDDDDDDDDEDGRRIIPIALGLSAGGLKKSNKTTFVEIHF